MSSLPSCDSFDCNNINAISAKQLNAECFCKTLNREKLDLILKKDSLLEDILQTHSRTYKKFWRIYGV
jgi:hypothetical protein